MEPADPVVVLGATSLVGRFLLPQLDDEGTATIAISRSARAGPSSARSCWRVADLAKPETLRSLGAVERVFSLSPVWLLAPALPVLSAAGMTRLVAFSSTSLFTKRQSASPEERNVAQALADGEAAVEAFCMAEGVRCTILRPTLIYSEGEDGNVSRLAALIRRFGVLPLPGEGRGLRQPVHAEDLATLARLAMNATAAGRYDAPGGETISYRVMAERIFEGLGRRPRVLTLPEPLIRLGFGMARPWMPGSSLQMVERINQDLVFDAGPVREAFGWSPRSFRPNFNRP
jgi:nucleoside-diphosphate-sugar epimerase